MKKSHLVLAWLSLMLCLSAFMLANVGKNVGTNVHRRKAKDEPKQSLAKLLELGDFENVQLKNSRSSHQTRPAAKETISELPPTINSAKQYFSPPTNESIAKWLANPTINKWKSDWRTKVTTAWPEDLFGPPEGYPCASRCPGGRRAIDNTVCPMMHPEEQRLVMGALRPGSVVWEWGTGISSLYYSQCVGQWTSIEHDTGWCATMKSVSPPNVHVFCVPIEPEYKESFGSPGTWDGSIGEFRSYVQAARSLKECDGCVDVAIIDGRARADCAKEILAYLRDDSIVILHDWISARMGERDNYGAVLDYYDMVDQIRIPAKNSGRAPSGIVKLRPKPAAHARARRAAGLPTLAPGGAPVPP